MPRACLEQKLTEQDILKFDVSMHDVLTMQIRASFQEVIHHALRLFLAILLLLQKLIIQLTTYYKSHLKLDQRSHS